MNWLGAASHPAISFPIGKDVSVSGRFPFPKCLVKGDSRLWHGSRNCDRRRVDYDPPPDRPPSRGWWRKGGLSIEALPRALSTGISVLTAPNGRDDGRKSGRAHGLTSAGSSPRTGQRSGGTMIRGTGGFSMVETTLVCLIASVLIGAGFRSGGRVLDKMSVDSSRRALLGAARSSPSACHRAWDRHTADRRSRRRQRLGSWTERWSSSAWTSPPPAAPTSSATKGSYCAWHPTESPTPGVILSTPQSASHLLGVARARSSHSARSAK